MWAAEEGVAVEGAGEVGVPEAWEEEEERSLALAAGMGR